MKRGTPRHPKTKRLARRLGIKIPHAVGILEMLWHYAGEFTPQGDIGRDSDEDISEGVGWHKDAAVLIKALVDEKWLDADSQYRLIIHDWPDHADDSVRKKLARGKIWFLSVYPRCPEPPDSVATMSRHSRDAGAPRAGKARLGSGIGKDLSSEESVRGTKPILVLPPQQHGDWPLTIGAIHGPFPDTDLPFIEALVRACAQTFAGISDPKCKFTDQLVADAVLRVKKTDQQSAGLFARTVPACIRTWAMEGIQSRAGPKKSDMEIRRERSEAEARTRLGQ